MKTIRLKSDNYRFFNGRVERFVIISDDVCNWRPTPYQVGRQVVLLSSTDVSPNAIRAGTRQEFGLSFNLDGVPCNSNSRIKKINGWCGTTDNISVDAHGIVTIRSIRELKNGDIAITVW